jgi:hypothetical protein
MKVVGKQSPGLTARLSLFDQLACPLNEAVAIFTVIKYFSAANAPGNDVMQGAGSIDAGLTWHACFYLNASESCQL